MGGDHQYRRMVATMVRLTLLTAIFIAIADANLCEPLQLEHAIPVIRHGPRYPVFEFGNNPLYQWPGGLGALTANGKIHMRTLGLTMRSRYWPLFVRDGFRETTRIKSSSRQRCLDSALAFLGGLMNLKRPATRGDIREFEVMKKNEDNILLQSRPCKWYEAEFAKWRDNPPKGSNIDLFNNKFQSVYKYIAKHTGDKVNNAAKVAEIYDTILTQFHLGVPVPVWARKYFPNPMKEIRDRASMLRMETLDMRRNQHKILTNIATQFGRKMEGKDWYKQGRFHAYSAHDSTLTNIISALDLTPQLGWEPQYGAALVFEMYRGNAACGDNLLKVVYYPYAAANKPINVNLPFCPHPCRMTTFQLRARQTWLTNEGFDAMCQQPNV